MRRSMALGLAALATAGACADAPPDEDVMAGTTMVVVSEGSSSTGEPEPPPPEVTACPPGTDVTGAPQTIAEAVAMLNALPRPVTLDCFVERLQRPLSVAATFSTVSLQPADGERSPRVFIFYDDLVMSIAIDGAPGSTLLEFGELVSPTQSIKGEIEFPVTAALAPGDPTASIADGEGSKCRLCHGHEAADPTYDGAFVSDALQFRADEAVELQALLAEHEACAPDAEPDRCARLAALFEHGDVVASPFPYDLPTIYDYD